MTRVTRNTLFTWPLAKLPTPLRVAVLAEWLEGAKVRLRRDIAAHQDTPALILERLTKDRRGSVRAEVAANPSTPVEVLRKMASRGERAIDLRLASNPTTPEAIRLGLLQGLTEDEYDRVCYLCVSVAEDPSTPPGLLEQLAINTDSRVRRAVAGNAFAPVALLERQAMDTDGGLRRAVASNGATPITLLERLAKDTDLDVRRAVVGNRTTPVALLDRLSKDYHWMVRGAVACNTAAPPAALERLGHEGEYFGVRALVAQNIATPVSVLARLARDTVDQVRTRVVENVATPKTVLEILAVDPDRDVRKAARKNLCSSRWRHADARKALAGGRAPPARASGGSSSAVASPAMDTKARNAPTERRRLAELAESGFWSTRIHAIEDLAFPADLRAAAYAALSKEFTQALEPNPSIVADQLSPKDFIVPLTALDLMPEPTDKKAVASAARSNDWLARAAAALCEGIVPSQLRTLLDDEVEVVRQLAIHRLKALEPA